MTTPLNGSLLKGFAILGLFSSERTEITAAMVTTELNINAATAHRFLTTLEETGALVSFRRGRYCLAHRIEELGRLAEISNPLSHIVRPVIDDVARTLGESVMACRLGNTGPTCIAVATSSQPISVSIKVGTVLPLHSTAQGKLWLAHLPERERNHRLALELTRFSKNTITDVSLLEKELATIRDQGFACNLGENEPDIGAVSMPILSTDGRMILSLSVFGMLSRFDDALTSRIRPELVRAVRRVEEMLT